MAPLPTIMKQGILLSILFIFIGCTKQDNLNTALQNAPAGSGMAQAGGNHPPEVVSATIMPNNPVVDKPLFIQIVGRDSDGDPIRYEYRWFVDGETVKTGPEGSLEPGVYQKGSSVFAEIIPYDDTLEGSSYRTPSIVILNQPPVVTSVTIAPMPIVPGTIVKVDIEAFDPDGDVVDYRYQWNVNGRPLSEATQGLFDTSKQRKGDLISVVVTPFDDETEGRPVSSGAVTISNSSPKIVSSPKQAVTESLYMYKVEASDQDGDNLTYALEKSPPGMTINPSNGLIRWEVPNMGPGRHDEPIKIVVDDGDGGKATQEFFLTIEVK